MISFIQHEAAEKIEEIEVETEEEFNIEKSRLVSQQHIKIIEYYNKKEKQIELKGKIHHSIIANANRLLNLQARDDYVQALKEEARKQLSILTKNRSKYIYILSNLITEGLFVLMEENIRIKCREDDYGLVQRLIPDSIRRYKRVLQQINIQVTVDDKSFLSDDLAGGVELYGMDDKIYLSNTIEARLEIIFHNILPEIRRDLFGINQNRKYNY
ncbi:unnamed protein product [Rotaria sp. Silwood2]|nr:unnamed protein product [Rotaria sp. Silwood2]CAF3061005.1 unnamed protein product [Rotaria sp. Silwood2]CAF3081789.1 unnamed protein product [Rotaria sp. Silwood2]CAF3270541.1 unnamed protein product [Rotaria sp. Silwood2]CAF4118719.1 unnamed protein product [Rotaria sp. Silwood2]